MVEIKFKKLSEDAIIPKFSRKGDAALDLHTIEDYQLKPNERHAFKTGLASSFPEGYVLLYRGRSGLAFKNGINPLAGVIDSNYRGEHMAILHNTGTETVEIKKGDRVVQAILMKLPDVDVIEVDDLDESIRGENGFGSSGK